MFFSFNILNVCFQSFLAFQFSVDKSKVILIFLPLYIRNLFPLAALKMVSLVLRFASFTLTCLGVGLFSLILGCVLSVSRTWMLVSFLRLGKFSATVCSNISYTPPFSLQPLKNPNNSGFGRFHDLIYFSNSVFKNFKLVCSRPPPFPSFLLVFLLDH